MKHSIIAYGRVSSRGQNKKSEEIYQQTCIGDHFPNTPLDFEYDQCCGDVPLEDRPALANQLSKARLLGEPLWLDHRDRLAKTFDPRVLAANERFLALSGVTLRFVVPSIRWHRIFNRIIFSSKPQSWKVRRLVVRVEQQLLHRKRTLFPNNRSAKVPPRPAYQTLKTRTYLYVLEECARHILALKDIPNKAPRNRRLDAYLGAAFNRKYIEHKAVLGKKRSVHVGQRTYVERPDFMALHLEVLRAQQLPNFYRDGRAKAVSDQAIANYLNEHTNLRNMVGKPFNHKNIYDLRHSSAFQQMSLATPTTSTLPNLGESP